MTENVIRKLFGASNWPPKSGAFQHLITFIVEGLAPKAESSTVQALQSDLDTEKGKITKLQGDYTTLKSQSDTNKTNIESLQSKYSTLNSSVETMSPKVTKLEGDYTSLEARVKALESPSE